MVSTAIFEGAQTNNLSPRNRDWRINSITVEVFPVPGYKKGLNMNQ